MGEHKRSISSYNPTEKKTQTPVGKHFSEAKHNAASLRWMVLEQVDRPLRGGDRKKTLLQCEARWMERLNCIEPFGINEAWSLKCFL
ncbi:hypothetical protein XELAEV_18001293mg [Xenopus laevis]|nr:hypothetical protein XELAEV_18001293mg [Xenopus laevis]